MPINADKPLQQELTRFHYHSTAALTLNKYQQSKLSYTTNAYARVHNIKTTEMQL